MKRMKYLALGISCVFFNVLMAAVDFRGSNYADRIFATEEHPADYFVDANFSGCTITNCDFSGLNLTGANFTDANLIAQGEDGSPTDSGSDKKIDFSNATLTSVRFNGASMIAQGGNGGDYVGDNSAGNGGNGIIDFSNTTLTTTNFSGVVFRATGGSNGIGEDFMLIGRAGAGNINFGSAILTGTNFSRATFTASQSINNEGQGNINFNANQNMTNIDFSNVVIASGRGGNIDFTDSVLTGSNFSTATIQGNFGAIRFTRTNLTSVNFKKSHLSVQNSTIEFTAANVTKANFNHTVFSVANGFIYMINGDYEINFSYTNFSGAIGLDKITFNYTQPGPNSVSFNNTVFFNTTIPEGIQYTGNPITSATTNVGSLIGANYLNIDLSGLDLSGIDLSNIVLNGADLTGAILRQTNLTGIYMRNTQGFDQLDYLGNRIDAYTCVNKLPQHCYLLLRNGEALPFIS